MRVKVSMMYLGYRKGQNDDGTFYYQGQFLEKGSNKAVRLYFPDDSKLKNWQPYKDYDLECELYVNSKNLWALKVV